MKKYKQKQIAGERITILLNKAKEVYKKDPSLSNRYVTLARKIAMKTRTRVPRNLQKLFCKHCYKFLMPGSNCRIRTKNNKVVYYCFNCKKYMRFPFIKEKKLRKSLKLK